MAEEDKIKLMEELKKQEEEQNKKVEAKKKLWINCKNWKKNSF